jgi:hypothetical protein
MAQCFGVICNPDCTRDVSRIDFSFYEGYIALQYQSLCALN